MALDAGHPQELVVDAARAPNERYSFPELLVARGLGHERDATGDGGRELRGDVDYHDRAGTGNIPRIHGNIVNLTPNNDRS